MYVLLFLRAAYINNNAKLINVEIQQVILKSGNSTPIIRRCRRPLNSIPKEPTLETKCVTELAKAGLFDLAVIVASS